MKRVALVTAAQARTLDEDLPPLLKALPNASVEVWDDPRVDWDAFDLAVVRSTWDYVPRREEFLRWAGRVPRLANPAPILRWNTDKRYLRELEEAGIPIVPTQWVAPGESFEIRFDGPVVVKPTVGAGAKDAARHESPATAAEHVRRLQVSGRTAMIQPYQADIDRDGETGLVYLGGEFSHAIRKGAILRPDVRYVDGLYAQEEIRPRDPTAAERALAERILARVPGVLYARVDLAPGPLLLELELAEPSLFFAFGHGSAERMARAILNG